LELGVEGHTKFKFGKLRNSLILVLCLPAGGLVMRSKSLKIFPF
jgi:hypothetical protein